MKFIIKQEPQKDFIYDEISDYDCDMHELECVITTSEDMNAIQMCRTFFKAMEVEGYHPQSILQAMHDYSEYEAFQTGYIFKKIAKN